MKAQLAENKRYVEQLEEYVHFIDYRDSILHRFRPWHHPEQQAMERAMKKWIRMHHRDR